MSNNLYETGIFKRIQDVGLISWFYTKSFLRKFTHDSHFDSIHTYCMFIGYSKSGKTFLSSLLDAHPHIVFANELPVLRYVDIGFDRRQIFYLILENSRTFTEAGRSSRGCSYQVPNQWQGRFNQQIKVIGDNKGEGTTLRLRGRLWMLQRLQNTIGIKIKFIHLIRNPFDNISYMAMVRKSKLNLEQCIDYYFGLCETMLDIKNVIDDDSLLEIRYECFVAKPRYHLENICNFLGVDAPDNYLDDCVSVVFKQPVKSRYDVNWNQELIDSVYKKIESFPFLDGYTYEN